MKMEVFCQINLLLPRLAYDKKTLVKNSFLPGKFVSASKSSLSSVILSISILNDRQLSHRAEMGNIIFSILSRSCHDGCDFLTSSLMSNRLQKCISRILILELHPFSHIMIFRSLIGQYIGSQYPGWILIALIGLGPLEENMNPLFFWYQPVIFTMIFQV